MKTTSIYAALALTLVSQNSSAQWVPTAYSDTGSGSNNPISRVNAMVVKDSFLFAATDSQGVLRSVDNGDSWVRVNNGLPIFDTLVRLKVFSLAVGGLDLYAGLSQGTVARSTDDGNSWDTSSAGLITAHDIYSLAAGEYVFAGGLYEGVFRSSDHGATWGQVTPGSPVLHGNSISAFLIVRLTLGSNLFAGSYDEGVFRSADNAATWWHPFSSPQHIWGLAQIGIVILAAAYDGGIMRSTDGGTTWNLITAGLPTKIVTSVAASGKYAFCGSFRVPHPDYILFGMGASIDSGLTWRIINEGLPYGCVNRVLAVKDTFLFASLEGANYMGAEIGIWRRSIPEIVRFITSVEEPRNDVPLSFGLQQNYPNPFNPSTTIAYQLPRSAPVNLSIYDMLGREVSVLVNERKAAGSHEVTFDGSGLASGVYFYRLTTGEFVQTRKLVLMK